MIYYKEQGFNEKYVINYELNTLNEGTKREYYTISIYLNDNRHTSIIYSFSQKQDAISSLKEITKLINDREELLLKLKAEN